jgi:hypothetical protein
MKSFKLLLVIAAVGILAFTSNAQSFITNSLPGPFAIGTLNSINLNGLGILTDSYNSHDTNLSTGGQYDSSKTSTNGNVASVQGLVNLGSHTIIGNLYLGPTATYASSGIVTGNIYTNYNVQFPDVTLPPGASSWPTAAPVTVKAGNKNETEYDFTTPGFYIINQDLPIVVEYGVTVFLNVTSSTFSGSGMTIHGGTTNSGTAALYFNGPTSVTIAANTAVDTSNRPENLWYIGLPSLTSITYNMTAAFAGVIYAPEASMTLNGGGSPIAIAGSVIVNNIVANGHYFFHFDESLESPNVWIISQPTNQTVPLGANAIFTVSATGTAPLWYQWFYNQTNLLVSGTNYSSLSLTNVQSSDAGNYSVIVSNAYNSVTSSIATLTVIVPPTITAQPLDQRILLGGSAPFTVSVSGTPPFQFQWQFNLTNILNATNGTDMIPAVATTDTGYYSVVVTNLAGSVTSSNALLTVIIPPTVSLQFLNGSPVLNLSGMLSNNFVVQYNTDLTSTNWMDLLSISNLSSSPYQFIDPDGIDQPVRFYRVIMQ